MKLSSLFKTSSESSSSYSPYWAWPLPACGKPKTVSFRAEAEAEDNIFKTLNSAYQVDDMTSYSLDHEFFSESERSFSNTTIDASELSIGHHDYIETMIRGLRLEKERLFFEPEKTSSIVLEEANKNIINEQEGGNISPFYFKESAVMALDSKDPFVDFRKSMEDMVEAHGIQDWENLEELFTCYLKLNCKTNHGYIVAAFVDLLVSLAFTSENINNGASSSCAIMRTADEEHCLSPTITNHSFTSPLSFCSSTSSTTSTSACLSLLLEEAEIIQQNADSSASSSHI